MLRSLRAWLLRTRARKKDFQSTISYIWRTHEICGIERPLALMAYGSRMANLAFWLTVPFEVESETADRKGHQFIEPYLIVELAILWATLKYLAWPHPWLSSAIAIYALLHIYFALFDIVFVGKLIHMRAIISVERSLLLFAVNAAEIVIGFAIFYRVALWYEPIPAIIASLLVFGTVGHPLDSNLRFANQDWAGIIVGIQLCSDFLFIAIFLSAFLGGLRPR
jgi:hypothetical protein